MTLGITFRERKTSLSIRSSINQQSQEKLQHDYCLQTNEINTMGNGNEDKGNVTTEYYYEI